MPTDTDSPYARAIAYATAEGTAHGRAAASWVIDGNTTEATARAILRGIEDGDPAILDTLPSADLSGQWADTLTGPQLFADAYADADPDHPADEAMFWHPDAFTAVCDAYETAYATAVEDAIVSACKAVLA